MTDNQVFGSVWDALYGTPEEADDLQARSELMMRIEEIINNEGWTPTEAASHCRIPVSRINDLLRGKISKFSLNDLSSIITTLDLVVRTR